MKLFLLMDHSWDWKQLAAEKPFHYGRAALSMDST